MNIKSVGLRGGHSKNCRGARGYVDEWETMQKLFSLVKSRLENRGIKVVDCNSNANTERGELYEGTNKANNNNVDAYFTLHMNAFNDLNANGVECIVYESGNKPINTIANNICSNISNTLGLRNRGIKAVPKDHDVTKSNMPAIIIETGFCTNANDANKISNNLDKVAECIVNAVLGVPNNIIQPTNNTDNRKHFNIRMAGGFSFHQLTASGQDYCTLDMKNGESLESIAIQIEGFNFLYRVNVSQNGRSSWLKNGFYQGCYNNGQGIEGLEMKNNGEPPQGYQIQYRVYLPGKGWTGWGKDGEFVGNEGNGAKKITAVEVRVEKIA